MCVGESTAVEGREFLDLFFFFFLLLSCIISVQLIGEASIGVLEFWGAVCALFKLRRAALGDDLKGGSRCWCGCRRAVWSAPICVLRLFVSTSLRVQARYGGPVLLGEHRDP